MAAPFDRANLRRTQRIKVTPKGEIIKGEDTVKVLLQDISDDGFLLICSREFEAGEIFVLKFHISPRSSIECTVEVRHSSDMGTGVRIISMNEQSRRTFDHYLQEYFSNNHGRLG